MKPIQASQTWNSFQKEKNTNVDCIDIEHMEYKEYYTTKTECVINNWGPSGAVGIEMKLILRTIISHNKIYLN